MQLIQSAMDGGHRMLLFSQFTSMLAILQDKLEKEGIPYYIITGETSKQKRQELVKQFNSDTDPCISHLPESRRRGIESYRSRCGYPL